MKTRSAKAAAKRKRGFSLESQDTGSGIPQDTGGTGKRKVSDSDDVEKEGREPKSKRTTQDVDDYEEERAKPSKADYNNVRKALILARSEGNRKDAALKELTRELEEKDRTITDKEFLLLKCSEVLDRIREIQDACSGLRPMNPEMGRGDPSETVPSTPVVETSPEPPESLKEMLIRLKSSIDEFANKYFSGKLHAPLTAQLGAGWAHQYMQATTPGEETYMDYLHSRHRCPMIIEAFIWRFLCGMVFNGVPWGGNENFRLHVSGLQGLLAQFHNSPHSRPEQMKKFQEWRRHTTEMVLQIHSANTAPADLHLSQIQGSFATAISEVIVAFMRTSLVGHEDDLNNIIREAIALDMEISRQLPSYTWRFSNRLVETPFNFCLGQENVMKLHTDEKTASELSANMKARVYLVVAPGLTQRGLDNSASTTFEQEYWVAPMEVTCVRPKRQKKFAPANDGSDTTVE